MKARKVLLWIVAVPAALYALAYAASFQTTKPIEGTLVDARTGKPVSKAMVHVNWVFRYPNLVDTTGGGFGHGTFTNEAGRFRIPRRNATAVIGRFVDQEIMVKHPLYEFLHLQVYLPSDREKPYRVGQIENGMLKLTLPIMSLEDKYSKPEDNKKLQWEIDNCGPDFYESMLKNYNIGYDIPSIMKHLEYLANRFPEHGEHTSGLKRTFTEHKFYMDKYQKTHH